MIASAGHAAVARPRSFARMIMVQPGVSSMRYAHTAVHVYVRPPALRGAEGAAQLALGFAEALLFMGLLYAMGWLIARIL